MYIVILVLERCLQLGPFVTKVMKHIPFMGYNSTKYTTTCTVFSGVLPTPE